MKSKLQFRASKFTLAPNKTYIVPTGFGLAFGVLSFILLVMAIGYGNNILYFFVFLLVSMGMTCSWLTNKNIESVKIVDLNADYIFANEKNSLLVEIKNLNKKSNLWDIELKIEMPKKVKTEINIVDEIENSQNTLIAWTPKKRGQVKVPRLLIQSRFPYKLLRAWKYFDKKDMVIVLPERRGLQNINTLLGNQADKDQMAKLENEGLFRDYREYQRTDSPSRIDWKRSLKHQKHLVKNYERSGERKILIDWDMTSFLTNIEDRISQMALWVDLCHAQNELFSMKINSYQTEYFATPLHYKACLEKLALLEMADLA